MGNEINKCIIVSGAPCSDYEFIKSHIKDEYIIAADSGYVTCINADITPDLIIGDFDSSQKPCIAAEIISLNKEKAYSDTMHCVIEAKNRGYNHIDIINAIGDRIDHSYANILCLDYCNKNDINCKIITNKCRLSLINGTSRIPKEYENFSLFAFMSECKKVKISGAYYTAGFYDKDYLDISPSDQFALSNFVTEDYATVSLEEGTLLLIESND